MFFIPNWPMAMRGTLKHIARVRWFRHEEGRWQEEEFTLRKGELYSAIPLSDCEKKFETAIYQLLGVDCRDPSIVFPPECNNAWWKARVLQWEHEPASLDACIEEFRAANLNLADPENASTQCLRVSYRFMMFLLKRKAITEHMIERGRVGIEPCMGGQHWYLRIENMVIDWTKRQFDPNCSFPHIEEVKAVRA